MKKELKITPKKQAAEKSVETTQAEAFAEKILTNIHSAEAAGATKRVNFDMPVYLFNMMQDKVKQRGYTIKTYMTGLVRKDLGEE